MIRLNRIICGDALAVLKTFPSESVHMTICSPPYFRLHDNGVPSQIGRESSCEEQVTKLCDVFDEVQRVLRSDGTCWVNLADSYSRSSLTPQYRCLIPFRFAIEMVHRGWRLRNVLIWRKPNIAPDSVTDRFPTDFEYVFFFAKSRFYYFKQQFEPAIDREYRQLSRVRNKRCVWKIPTKGFTGNRSAVYLDKLVETSIQAGCPEGGVVLDPFLGTGTTAVVAERLGRRWVGIERNPAYVALAQQRLQG